MRTARFRICGCCLMTERQHSTANIRVRAQGNSCERAMWCVSWITMAVSKFRQKMAAAEGNTAVSFFWRIDVSDGLNASVCNDDDADTAATEMTVVLRRAAATNLPLQAYVFNHKYTESACDFGDGVTRRWREPSHFDVHGLVHLQGDVSFSELDLRGRLLEMMETMDPLYLNGYHTWSFIQIGEREYSSMCEEDLHRACCDHM